MISVRKSGNYAWSMYFYLFFRNQIMLKHQTDDIYSVEGRHELFPDKIYLQSAPHQNPALSDTPWSFLTDIISLTVCWHWQFLLWSSIFLPVMLQPKYVPWPVHLWGIQMLSPVPRVWYQKLQVWERLSALLKTSGYWYRFRF